MDLSVREILPIITLRQNGYGALQGHYFGMCSKTLPGEKRAFKPFAATGELQPSESKTATFLRKMTKKWPFGAPQVAILPLEAAKTAFFGKKEQKAALRKKKSRAGDRTRNKKASAELKPDKNLEPKRLRCPIGHLLRGMPKSTPEWKRDPSPQRKNRSLGRRNWPLFGQFCSKKWPIWPPEAAILPLEAAERTFFRQKRQKKGSSKKRQARRSNPIRTLSQNGYGVRQGHYFGIF